MSIALLTIKPFADRNGFPLEMLEGNGVDYRQNPLNRKLTEDELTELACCGKAGNQGILYTRRNAAFLNGRRG